MRFDRDQLIFRALCALDEAIDHSDIAPVKRTFALRFALAFLFNLSDGKRRDCYDEFWREIGDPKDHAFSESSARYQRTTHARTNLSGIARSVGLELTADLMERLRLARLQPPSKPDV